MEMLQGIITRMLYKRAFGFLRQADGSDVFFHAQGCLTTFDELREGMKVQYMVTIDHRTQRERGIGIKVVD